MSIHIPQTPVFKEKAQTLAFAYHNLSALQFVEEMLRTSGQQSATLMPEELSFALFDQGISDFMEVLGWNPKELTAGYLYDITDRPIQPIDRRNALKAAETRFKEAQESLYQQAAGVNCSTLSQSHHRTTSHAQMYEMRREGKRQIEEALNDFVAKVANNTGLRIPQDVNYFGANQAAMAL